ncbi:MAG TPA: thiamine phosphate synthase [Planctomycetota bacterium]|nr:thiamine phosphate synthase [Planctomycetota bacterium]
MSPRERLARSRLLLLFTRSLCRGDPLATLDAALRGGVDAVQVREKEATSRELLEWSRRVRERLADRPVLFFVNDRFDVARLAGADGVHLGQEDLPCEVVRAAAGADLLIGVSTHDLAQAKAAAEGGADYLGFGPIFPTATKGVAKGLGPGALGPVLAAVPIPIFPIGGIDPSNAGALAFAGRAAVSSSILGAEDPEAAARAIRAALGA